MCVCVYIEIVKYCRVRSLLRVNLSYCVRVRTSGSIAQRLMLSIYYARNHFVFLTSGRRH